MKKPTESTASSTTETEQRIRTFLPPGDQAYLFANDDELQHRRKSDFDTGQRARDARTAYLEAFVENAIRDKRPALEIKHRCFWTSILLNYFECKGIKPPYIELVRRVVKEFKGF